ncbi:hypothetical protein MANES_05G086500v8 [Manihot esculenta]|uniref:Uncharacterized protein n=1 Tax=Manihot esculenta TaxID=3983 RepID=A0A2C9VUK5_MANES|nr:hypothetical protein MANES_05G086500v8 [Manihot esculenta]
MNSNTNSLLLQALKVAIILILTLTAANSLTAEARTLHHAKESFAVKKVEVAIPEKNGDPKTSSPNPCTNLPVTDPGHCPKN